MKFTVSQREFSNALNILKNAVSTKTSIEILKGIHLSAKDDHLILKSYNLDFSITIDIQTVILEEGEVVLEYRILSDIVRKLPDEMISFSKIDQKMELVCQKSRYDLLIFDPSEYPIVPEVKEDEGIIMNQSLFKEMISMTNFAVSKEESNLVLTGAFLEVKKNTMKMICIDGFSVAIKEVSVQSSEERNVIIPGKVLSDLEKFIGTDISSEMNILIKDNYVAFFFDNIKVVSKVLQGKYVDYENILPKNFPMEVELDKKEFQRAIERSSLLAIYSRSYLIKLDFSNDQLEITSNSSMGTSSEILAIENKSISLKLGLNPNKILSALRVIDSDRIWFRLESSSRPCLLEAVGDDSYQYYIVPIRIREARE